jgi:5'-nucleotidase/UDP-sugar diphosphatase
LIQRLPLVAFAVVVLVVGAPITSCIPLFDGPEPRLAGQEVRLTLLHTSDIHSRLVPYDFAPLKTDVDLGLIPEAGPFGGATRLAALARRERARADRVIHLDSGDSFQGAPIFNVNFGEVEFKVLSSLHLDAAVVGNHEFDAGPLNFVEQAKNHAAFPLLSANYYWDDPKSPGNNGAALYTAPYTIKVVNGLRVGVIGMANISSLNSIVEGGNSLQVTPIEQNEAARAYVELLRPVTDLIVLVSHLGLHEDQDVIQGYEAYFTYERAKEFVERDHGKWEILEWFGEQGVGSSVVRVKIPGVSGVDVVMGGHLHVVLNPPQTVTDPSGRRVVLAHSGAFAKYMGRLDLVLQMPPAEGAFDGAEVKSYQFRVFPLDALWCDDAMHDLYRSQFWETGQFGQRPDVQAAMRRCTEKEDPAVTQLMVPYLLGMDFNLSLTTLFGYAPRDIARRNNSSGGDSPLGNIAADSMRKRRRVEAEMALTNTLGIRDNLYAGPLTHESMFNVFPFENTINIMYVSGAEIQEMLDFVAERSSQRGCQSQAQISGARFTMDCAQAQLNELRYACTEPNDCTVLDPTRDPTRAPWQCVDDAALGGRCWAHSGTGIQINGKPIDPNGTYKIAVNDYIAKGGSGFNVLKRNTTRIETGISLRESLIGYMQSFCSCDDLAADRRDKEGLLIGKNGQLCGNLINGQWVIDDLEVAFCRSAQSFKDELLAPVGSCNCADILRGRAGACGVGEITAEMRQECSDRLPPGPAMGGCVCKDALTGTGRCGHVTPQTRAFCENPTSVAVAVGVEDGRIGRRVK